MTQREFATLMGKAESEISRWLTGSHGFTTTTLVKIEAVLEEPVVEVIKERPQPADSLSRKRKHTDKARVGFTP